MDVTGSRGGLGFDSSDGAGDCRDLMDGGGLGRRSLRLAVTLDCCDGDRVEPESSSELGLSPWSILSRGLFRP